MKEFIKPINVLFFLWGLLLLVISNLYAEYVRYYLYLSLVVIIPITIVNSIKQKRQDTINGTTLFRSSIYRMLIMAIVFVVVFFVTRQNHI